MDWRETGEAVRERGRQCLSDFAKKELGGRPRIYPATCILGVPVASLAGVYENGEDYLCRVSAVIFRSPQEREAFYTRLCHRKTDLNGRPRGEASRAAATVALFFYDAWHGENEKRGISDYGHRGEMKDIAARAIVEDLFAWRLGDGVRPTFVWELRGAQDVESFYLVTRDLMEKPKSRRSPSKGAQLEFLGSSEGLELPPKPPGN
jgi:hypothetical protein